MATRKTKAASPARSAPAPSVPEPPKSEPLVMEAPAPRARKEGGRWLEMTYDGSGVDSSVVPEVLRIGEDGKPMKRKIIRPASYTKTKIEVYELWGIKFPEGETVRFETGDPRLGKNTPGLAKLAIKARALSCFTHKCSKGLIEDEEMRQRERRKLRRG